MLISPLRWLPLFFVFAAAHAAHPPAPAKSGPRPEVIGFWHFEHDVKTESRNSPVGPANRAGSGVFFFNDDVPGPYIYDPIQKLSYPDSASLSFQSDERQSDALEIAINTAKAGLAGQSVTLEFFFKPSGEWDGPLAMKARLNDNACEWGLGAHYFEDQRQTLLDAFFTPAGGRAGLFRAGAPGTTAQIRGTGTEWRHIAFVYDATAAKMTSYVDYYLARTVAVPGEMKWDAGALYIGGGPGRSTFTGLIDEVRLTKAALRPGQFLHARHDPIAGVSLESVEILLPRDCGYIDVKECFGALGDGRTDDTPAFREAFRVLSNQPSATRYTLYIPPGTYLISETLQSNASMIVQGAGSAKTVLKLRDKCQGFTKPAEPRAFWRLGPSKTAADKDPIPVNPPFISIYNLTIDTGKGNAGAKGLETVGDLLRRLDDIAIRSGDAGGVAGLEFAKSATGTVLAKNLRIKGFDCGVLCAAADAAITFEQLDLEAQRTTGLKNDGSIVAIRQLTSMNKASALTITGSASMTTLLDSALKGGGKEAAAIEGDGALYVLRIETAGYKSAIRKRLPMDEKTREVKEETIAGPKVDEYIGGQVLTGHGTLTKALKLPIQNTPEVAWGDIHNEWVSVEKFSEKKNGDDWGPAIQAAIDSGARTVYFPPGHYEVSDALHLRGRVERLFGLNSRIARGGVLAPSAPSVIFDEPDGKRAIAIERLEIEGLRHASPATLILNSTSVGSYEAAAGCGNLFLEDVGGSDFQLGPSQKVWARQWNYRNQRVAIHGATVWCLGFTAGGDGSALLVDGGARAEFLGGDVIDAPLDRGALFSNTDAQLSLIYGAAAEGVKRTLQIVDTQGADVKQIEIGNLTPSERRSRMDLYTSDATAADKK